MAATFAHPLLSCACGRPLIAPKRLRYDTGVIVDRGKVSGYLAAVLIDVEIADRGPSASFRFTLPLDATTRSELAK